MSTMKPSLFGKASMAASLTCSMKNSMIWATLSVQGKHPSPWSCCLISSGTQGLSTLVSVHQTWPCHSWQCQVSSKYLGMSWMSDSRFFCKSSARFWVFLSPNSWPEWVRLALASLSLLRSVSGSKEASASLQGQPIGTDQRTKYLTLRGKFQLKLRISKDVFWQAFSCEVTLPYFA